MRSGSLPAFACICVAIALHLVVSHPGPHPLRVRWPPPKSYTIEVDGKTCQLKDGKQLFIDGVYKREASESEIKQFQEYMEVEEEAGSQTAVCRIIVPGASEIHPLRRSLSHIDIPGEFQERADWRSMEGGQEIVARSSRNDRLPIRRTESRRIHLQDQAAAVGAVDETVRRAEAWTVSADTDDQFANGAKMYKGTVRVRKGPVRYAGVPEVIPELPDTVESSQDSLPSSECSTLMQAGFEYPVVNIRKIIAEFEKINNKAGSKMYLYPSSGSNIPRSRWPNIRPQPAGEVSSEQILVPLKWTVESEAMPETYRKKLLSHGTESEQILFSKGKTMESSEAEAAELRQTQHTTAESGRTGFRRDFKPSKTMRPREIETMQVQETYGKAADYPSRTEHERTVEPDRTGFLRDIKSRRTMQLSEIESEHRELSQKMTHSSGTKSVKISKSPRKTIDTDRTDTARDFGHAGLGDTESTLSSEPNEGALPAETEYVKFPKASGEMVESGSSEFTRKHKYGKKMRSDELETAHSGRTEHLSVELGKLPIKTISSHRPEFTRDLKTGQIVRPTDLGLAQIPEPHETTSHPFGSESAKLAELPRKAVETEGFKPSRTMHPSDTESAQISESHEETIYPSDPQTARPPKPTRRTVESGKFESTSELRKSRKTLQSSETGSVQLLESSDRTTHSSRIGSVEHLKFPHKMADPERSGFAQDFKPSRAMRLSEIDSVQVPEPQEKLASETQSPELPEPHRRPVKSDETGVTRDSKSSRMMQSSEHESRHILGSPDRIAHSFRAGVVEGSESHHKTADSERTGFTPGSRSSKTIQIGQTELGQIPEPHVHAFGTQSPEQPELPGKTVRSGRAGFIPDHKSGEMVQSSEMEPAHFRESSDRTAHSSKTGTLGVREFSGKMIDAEEDGFTHDLELSKTIRPKEIELAQISDHEKMAHSSETEFVKPSKRYHKAIESGGTGLPRDHKSSKSMQSSEFGSTHFDKSSDRATHSLGTESAEFGQIQGKTVSSGRSEWMRDQKSGTAMRTSKFESSHSRGSSDNSDTIESAGLLQSSDAMLPTNRAGSKRYRKSRKLLRSREIESEQAFSHFGHTVHPLHMESEQIQRAHDMSILTRSQMTTMVPLEFFKVYLFRRDHNWGNVRKIIAKFETCENMRGAFITCSVPSSSVSSRGGSSRGGSSRGGSSLDLTMEAPGSVAIRRKPAQSSRQVPEFCRE